MVEATFQFDNKNQNIVITDLRAMAIRVSNLLVNKDLGLPGNGNYASRIYEYISEPASGNTKAMLEQEINDSISKYLGVSANVSVEYEHDPRVEGRKSVAITVKFTDSTNNGVIVMHLNEKGDGVEMSDLNIV